MMTAPQLMTMAVPGVRKPGVTVEEPTHCGFCARAIPVGEHVRPLADLPSSFTDQPALVADSWCICAECSQLGDREYLQTFACAIVTPRDVFAFRKGNDISWFFYHPPPAPFLALVSTKKMQHIVWKAQVNLSSELFTLCIDGDNHWIRRAPLMQAVAASRAHYAAIEARRAAAKTREQKDAIGYPRYLLRSSFDVAFSAEICSSANTLERSLIQKLAPGELWLMARVQGHDPTKLTPAPSLLS